MRIQIIYRRSVPQYLHIVFTALTVVRDGKSTQRAYIYHHLYRLKGANNTNYEYHVFIIFTTLFFTFM